MTGSGPTQVTVALQPLRWWHLDSVVELEQRTFGPTAWTLGQFYAELAADGRWLRALVDSTTLTVHGYVDVAVAGRDADLMTIVVAPELAGRGWGAMMLTAAMAAAAAAGARTMFLEVRSDNPAQHLYERFGFARIDLRRDYYGAGIHAHVMRARLPGEQAT